jgi:hypothetical protein
MKPMKHWRGHCQPKTGEVTGGLTRCTTGSGTIAARRPAATSVAAATMALLECLRRAVAVGCSWSFSQDVWGARGGHGRGTHQQHLLCGRAEASMQGTPLSPPLPCPPPLLPSPHPPPQIFVLLTHLLSAPCFFSQCTTLGARSQIAAPDMLRMNLDHATIPKRSHRRSCTFGLVAAGTA